MGGSAVRKTRAVDTLHESRLKKGIGEGPPQPGSRPKLGLTRDGLAPVDLAPAEFIAQSYSRKLCACNTELVVVVMLQAK